MVRHGGYTTVFFVERQETAEEAAQTILGWPESGGLWALRARDVDRLPRDAWRLYMALTMEERCRIILDFGAICYYNESTPQAELA